MWANTGTDRPRLGPRKTLLALAVLLLAPPPQARAAVVEEIVARVNNRIITKSEFEQRGEFILREIYREYSGEELDRQLRAAEESMLANMITELLLVERAETIFDLDKVRASLIDDFRQQQNIDSDEELERALEQQGMTRADLEEQLIRMAIPQEIVRYDVRRKISVSEREIERYYEKNIGDYTTPPTVTFREIVLLYEAANRPEVQTRARGILRELEAGADFLDLVDSYSEVASKEAGGLIGPLAPEDLLDPIARAAFALEPGRVSEPIDTGRSIHVIRLEEKTAKIVQPLGEVRDEIYDLIRERKFKPRFDRYIRRLWRESYVRVMPKYEHFLVVSPLKGGGGS
ncbi:MAG: peptidyl-prolyl cis-trans isomerase [Acidobacteriota bacterium]